MYDIIEWISINTYRNICFEKLLTDRVDMSIKCDH